MSSSEIKETPPIDQPALWTDDQPTATDQTTPAHLCNVAMPHTLDAFTSQGITDYLARSQA